MFDLFNSFKKLLKVRRTHIDNWIMRLNYSFTVIILLIFSIIISTREYSGVPITCLKSDNNNIPTETLNTYCWTMVTYVISDTFDKKLDVPFPGITFETKNNKLRYLNYYQWIWFILFIQATFFYAPRWLWKNWEGGLIEHLMMNLNNKIYSTEVDYVVRYLKSSKGKHNSYAYRFIFCEFLTLLNIITQFYFLNWLFNDDFLAYGFNVLEFYKFEYSSKTGFVNPMTAIFPKMTKCKYFKYGPSGNIETHDSLCLLPLNVINEKIYLFIWFWYLFLSILTFISLLFHFLLLLLPALRLNFFKKNSLKLISKEDENCYEFVLKTFNSFGDWFILHMLSENIDQLIYHQIINDLQSS